MRCRRGSGHLYYLFDDHFLTNGYAGVPSGDLPGKKYSLIAIDKSGTVFLAGDKHIALYKNGVLKQLNADVNAIISVTVNNGVFYALAGSGVYTISNDSVRLLHKGRGLKVMTFLRNDIILGTERGYYGISNKTGDSSFSLKTKLPADDISGLHVVNNKLWASSNDGGFMDDQKGGFRYFASKRWLNNNDIKGLTADSKGNIYFLSNSGVNEVRFVSQTLAEKTKYFQDNIRQRHIRYGFISNATLKKPGDISTAQLTDTDNDGLWSAFYLGSQAFRYAVTKEPVAKRYAWEAFEAFERLISINPLVGFPARTFERKGFKYSDPDKWHDSEEKEWEWKGTTSSDEFVGYLWVAAVLDQMVAQTADEKKRVAAFVDKIMTHIISHGYTLTDIDGKPTLWGRWYPEYVNGYPETVGDRRLNSSELIAGLQLAYALTGKAIYKTEAYKFINKYGYLKNITSSYKKVELTGGAIHMGIDMGDGWNHSDDEMAFLNYWVLYHYAFDKDLKEKYRFAIDDHWEIEKPEKNAVWNLVTLGTIGEYDKPSTLWHLREFPMDLVRWNVKNSQRKDLELMPPNFRGQTTKTLLPPGEAPMHRHNANPFELDGGENGMSELAGDEYLLPYWMARYLKVIN